MLGAGRYIWELMVPLPSLAEGVPGLKGLSDPGWQLEGVKGAVTLTRAGLEASHRLLPFPISVPALRPKERSRVRFEILPTRSGTKQLLANFSCNKFPAIKAMLSVDVAE